jgi:hypothetical protein
MKFTTKIEIIIGNPFVYVPVEILELIFKKANKTRGPIPVKGKLNDAKFKQTLVKYSGDWRLYLNGIMLKNAGFKFKTGEINSVVGEEVEVEIDFDSDSRKLLMHPDLKKSLAKDEKAKEAYDELAPYRKHEILRYLGFLKTQESIDKNIFRILQHLRGQESDALYPLMHRKKAPK